MVIILAAEDPGGMMRHFSTLVAKHRVWVPSLSHLHRWGKVVTIVLAQVRHDQRERPHQPQTDAQYASAHSPWSMGVKVHISKASNYILEMMKPFSSQAMPHINYALRQAGHSDTVADELTRALGLLAAHGVIWLRAICICTPCLERQRAGPSQQVELYFAFPRCSNWPSQQQR